MKEVVSDTMNNEVSEVMEVKTFEVSHSKSVSHSSQLGLPKSDIDKTKVVHSNVENERRKSVVRTEGTSKGTRGRQIQSNSNSSVKFPHNVHQSSHGDESESRKVQDDNTAQIRDRPCNDFSGTFMFDEDIELEFKATKDHSSLPKRYMPFTHTLLLYIWSSVVIFSDIFAQCYFISVTCPINKVVWFIFSRLPTLSSL